MAEYGDAKIPLVSILIPAYNAAPFVAEAIESALSQTWPNKEVIVVDDGSTDNTLAIARRYESTQLRVFSQENRGGAAARNRAYEHSRGDFIQWLDADDILHPEKIRCQLHALSQHASSRHILLTGRFGTFFYRTSHARFTPTALWQNLTPGEWILSKLRDRVWMNPAVWLVSRELADLGGQWDERLIRDQDGDYICRVIAQATAVVFVPESVSYYRLNANGSVSQTYTRDAYSSTLSAARASIAQLLALEDSPRSRDACIIYLQACLDRFYPDHPDLVAALQLQAAALGGQLVTPQLFGKHRMAAMLLGESGGRSLRRLLRRWRTAVAASYDLIMKRLVATADIPRFR